MTKPIKPVVGMGGTHQVGSDSYPYTIIEVFASGNRFEHTSEAPSERHTVKTGNILLRWTAGDNEGEQTVYIGNHVLPSFQYHKIEMVKAAIAFLKVEGYTVEKQVQNRY